MIYKQWFEDNIGLRNWEVLWRTLELLAKTGLTNGKATVADHCKGINSRVGYIRVIFGLYEGYIGIMEKKMETTIQGLGLRVWSPLSR